MAEQLLAKLSLQIKKPDSFDFLHTKQEYVQGTIINWPQLSTPIERKNHIGQKQKHAKDLLQKYTMRKELNIRYLRNTSNALERILKEENLLECNDLMSLPDANQ